MPAVKLLEPPAEDTQTELRTAKSRERDETQLAFDATFKNLLTRWEKAGKPDPASGKAVPAALTHRYVTIKDDVPGVKAMIRRSATAYKAGVLFFKDVTFTDGTVGVKFTVCKAPAKKH